MNSNLKQIRFDYILSDLFGIKTEMGGAEGIWEIGCGGKRGRGERLN